MCISQLHTSLANQLNGYNVIYYRCLCAWALFTFLLCLRCDGGLVEVVKAS